MSKLSGFIVYTNDPLDGQHFMSDAEPTLRQVKAKYAHSEITGFIDLSKIPDEAFIPRKEK